MTRARELATASRWWVFALAPQLLLFALQAWDGPSLNLFETGTVVTGGWSALHGRSLYTDTFAFYGPLAYLIPASAAVTGDLGILFFNGLAPLLATAAVYGAARVLTDRPAFSLAGPWFMTAYGIGSQRCIPVLIALLLVALWEKGNNRRYLAGAGVMTAVGLLYLQDAGAYLLVSLVVASAALWWTHRRWSTGLTPPSLGAVRVYIGSAVATFAAAGVAIGVVWSVHDWLYYSFYYPNVAYGDRDGQAYFRELVSGVLHANPVVVPYKFAFYVLVFFLPVVIIVFAGLRMRAAMRAGTLAAPLAHLALLIYSALQLRLLWAMTDESKLRDILPTFVVLLVASLALQESPGRRPRLTYAVAIAAVLLGLHYQARTLPSAIRSAAADRYLGFSVTSSPTASPSELRRLLARLHECPGDELFVAPNSPLIYFLSERTNVARYDYLDPLYISPTVDRQIVTSLRGQAPPCVVTTPQVFGDSQLTGSDIAPMTYRYLRSAYATADQVGPFRLLHRK